MIVPQAVGDRRRAILLTLVMLLPLVVIVLFIFEARPDKIENDTTKTKVQPIPGTRLVVIVIDSLRRQAVEELMPNLKAFAQQRGAVFLDVQTAGGNMTLPCMQTLMEGRESPYVSGIHNITGERSFNNSLPGAAATAGLKTTIIGDYVLPKFYGQYAARVVDLDSLCSTLSFLECDLESLAQLTRVLQAKDSDVILLHVPGTDAAAHKWRPGHPEYTRHFQELDAKLAEIFSQFDLTKDQIIITGDHGHNERGNHIPQSVAIFAGGIYPQLFAAIAPVRDLQQIDMFFFMAFPQNLPLPAYYEGRYFGMETALDPGVATTPELKSRMQSFAEMQKDTLAGAGFRASSLEAAIADKRTHANSMHATALKRMLPLLVLYLAWIVLAFHINDNSTARIWPLVAMAVPAIAFWFFGPSVLGIFLAAAILVLLVVFGARAGERRRITFLFLLVVGAAFTAFAGEKWHNYLSRGTVFTILGLGSLVAGGGLLMRIRRVGARAWPAAISAVCVFALPSGVYETQFGFNILRGFFIGCGLWFIALVARGRLPQITFRKREWIAGFFLIAASIALLSQQAHGLGWHHRLLDWLEESSNGRPVAVGLYLISATYLIWQTRGLTGRLILASALLFLSIYSSAFAQLRFEILAVVLIVPVFLVSWQIVTDAPGPLRDSEDGAEERAGLLLFATLLMAFWMLFQGFFIQEIDFAFGLRYVAENATEGRVVALLYPLTLLKYGLPLAIIVLVFVRHRGVLRSRQAIIAALIFCNFKLLALLVQTFVGPLHSHQKLYEMAMSDFVFVAQLEFVVVLSYLALLLGSFTMERARDLSI